MSRYVTARVLRANERCCTAVESGGAALGKIFARSLAKSETDLLHRRLACPNIRAALRGVVPLVTSRNGGPDPLEVWHPK